MAVIAQRKTRHSTAHGTLAFPGSCQALADHLSQYGCSGLASDSRCEVTSATAAQAGKGGGPIHGCRPPWPSSPNTRQDIPRHMVRWLLCLGSCQQLADHSSQYGCSGLASDDRCEVTSATAAQAGEGGGPIYCCGPPWPVISQRKTRHSKAHGMLATVPWQLPPAGKPQSVSGVLCRFGPPHSTP